MKINKKYAAASLIGLGLATLTGAGAVSAAYYTSDAERGEARAERQERMENRIANAVLNGKITQDQANQRFERITKHQASREARRVAVENNDYAAWAAAVAGTPMAEKVSAANFAKLVEAHNLREAGDHEAARATMQELGIDRGMHKRMSGYGGHFRK